jgi:hypothetical protein
MLMAAIKGWVYLFFGAVMIAGSQLGPIETKTGHKPLWIFLYIGILFAIIGIGKYIFRRGSKNSRKGQSPIPGSGNQAKPLNRIMTQEQMHQQRQAQRHANQPFNQQTSPYYQEQPTNFFKGQHQLQQAGERPVEHPSIIACPMCGTRHYDYAHYCMRCGTRIKDIRER